MDKDLPFRNFRLRVSRQINICDTNSQMNGRDEHKKLATCYGRDFDNDGGQEPNETLVNREQHVGV